MATTNMQFGQSAINVVLNEGQLPAKISTDASGNTVLVGADGSAVYLKESWQTGDAIVKPQASLGGSGSTTAYTFHTSLLVPFKFYAVTPFVINGFGAVTGATASVAVGVDASDPSLPNATPIACTLAGVSTFDVPAAPSATTPYILMLDRVKLSQVARSDAGDGYIAMCRIANPVGQHDLRGAAFGTSTATLDTHRRISRFAAGDATLSAARINSFFAAGASMGLIFHTDEPVTTFAAVGDSTMAGHLYETENNATSGLSKAIDDAQALGEYVSFMNFGIAGHTLAQYQDRLTGVLALSPSVCAFAPFTPNDASTQFTTGLDARLLAARDFLNDCRAANVVPILVTTLPNTGYTGATETARLAADASLIALARAYGVTVADRSAYYTDPAGGWISGMTTDGVHPNKTGIDGEAVSVWADIVTKRGRVLP